MKGDFTRWTYNSLKHYREVNMQQGRTQLDADWNEQNSIDFHYETSALQDVIGWSGTPVNSLTGYSDGFQIRITNLIIDVTSGTDTTTFTLDGFGFAAGEKVDLELTGPVLKALSTETASSSGTFTYLLTPPSTATPGNYTVVARGVSSGDTATATLALTSGATVTLNPSSGAVGDDSTLDGFGFAAGESLNIVASPSTGVTVSPVSASSNGSFGTGVAFAAGTSPGTYTIIVTGATSGDTATAVFTLTSTSMEFTPTVGAVGSKFFFDGYGFSPGETVTFALSGNTGLSIPNATAASDGSWDSSVVFPSSTSPGTYSVTATGSTSGDTATGSFFIVPYAPVPEFTIKHGHYYVNGVLCENEVDVSSVEQPDLPLFSGETPTFDPFFRGSYLVYLDVWERHITYLDDPEIREVALLGPDTATRTKIIWQVKAIGLGLEPVQVTTPPKPAGGVLAFADEAADTNSSLSLINPPSVPTSIDPGIGLKSPAPKPIADTPDCFKPFPEWTAIIAPSTGKLTARAKPTAPTGDPCEVPDEAGYTSLQNQLYRVEIHNGGELSKTSTATPTFKWSRDNGIVVSSVSNIDTSDSTATVLTVGSTGKNPNLSFLNNMWVEVTSDINDLWGLPGSLALVTSVNSPGQNTITLDPTSVVGAAITDASYPQEQNPKIRRWDWDQTLPTPPPYPLLVQIPTDNDGYLELEDGVEVKFADGTYKTGDYWLIPARTATADVDWPEEVVAVNWSAVPTGGLAAVVLAGFLVKRYGLDGIAPSDFVMSGTTEIDASYTDPSGVSHMLSIALNDDQTEATLTVDGIVGAEIPVITEADGSMSLQCGFPAPLPPEGIDHVYARLALFDYSERLRLAQNCPTIAIAEPASGDVNSGALFVTISPTSITVPQGATTTVPVSVSYTRNSKPAHFEGTLDASVNPTGPTTALSKTTIDAPPNPVAVTLTVSVPSNQAEGCYDVLVACKGVGDLQFDVSNSAYLTVAVPPAFVSPVTLLTDCRLLFPALIDVPRIFYVSGDGQTANSDYSLPVPLMAAAWSKVRFTIVKGAGTLTGPEGGTVTGQGKYLDVTPGSGTPDATTYPDLDHVAWVNWVIDQSTAVQIVRAQPLDSSGNVTDHTPIYYNAVLPGGGSQLAGSSAAASATTGIINVALQPGSAQLLGPFNHFLAVKTPPAILLALEAQYAGLPGGAMDIMDEANYTLLASDKAATSLDLNLIPIAAAYDITTQSFSVEILNPAGTDASPVFKLRWWAIPATAQSVQNVPGVWLTPGWVASNSATTVDIEGAYFNASAPSIAVSYTTSGGSPVAIQTFSPVTSNATYGGAFEVPSFSVPSGVSGWVQITATDGTSSPSVTLYVVQITATTSGTFPNLTVTMSGSGFAPYGVATIQLDNVTVATSHAVETNGGGSFTSAEFKTPASLASGTHTVNATVAGATATTTFTAGAGSAGLQGSTSDPKLTGPSAGKAISGASSENAKAPSPPQKPIFAPQLSLSIPTGQVGTDIAISGTGFSPNSKIALAFNQKILPEVMTNAQGTFIASFKVPQTGSGSHLILARDESTGKTVSATFKVP